VKRALSWLVAVSCLMGCDRDAAGPTAPPPLLEIVSGDGQEGAAGLAAPVDPTVRVTSRAGQPLADVEVVWQVIEGGGMVDAVHVLTDMAGRASVRWTLGDDVGAQLLYVTAGGAPGVTFQAQAGLYFSSVSAGWRHTCALDPRGRAWCWGHNGWGQLGSGTRTGSSESRAVAGRHPFMRVYAGMLHSCGLTEAGDAYCWGDNGYGQLGDGTTRNSAVPSGVAGGHRFSSLALGYVHTCGVSADGELYCWGGDMHRQTGVDGAGTCAAGGLNEPCFREPVRVALPGAAAAVAAAETHTCAANAEQRVYCWGRNDWGQLGTGSFGGSASAPAEVVAGVRLQQLSAWGRSTCGVDEAGSAWCWGQNAGGKLGINSMANVDRPTRVASGEVFVEVAVGDNHGCGRAADGAVYCWGAGPGSGGGSLAPIRVGDNQYSGLSAGGAHACGYSQGIWCWGSNGYGQLGLGTDSVTTTLLPVRVRAGPPSGISPQGG
jgi:alpha-tubulin suppressor-like RCC1 family protein